MRVACLDPLPRVGGTLLSCVRNLHALASTSLLESHSWSVTYSYKQPWHVFSSVKIRQILFGDSWTQINAGNRVGLGNYQCLLANHVFPVFPRILDVDINTYGHIHLDDIVLSARISQGEPLLAALFPKFTSPPRASLLATPQFRTCPTVWWWRRCAFFGGAAVDGSTNLTALGTSCG